MDLINGIVSMISGGGAQSSHEGQSINRITFFTIGRYFLYNLYYGNAVDSIPPPVLGNQFNVWLQIVSNTNNSVTIDWGDGSEEETYQFSQLSSGSYCLGFRSLNCEFYKSPTSSFGTLMGGGKYIPEPPRDYGSNGNRKVVFKFEKDITTINANCCYWSEFPLLETPNLERATLTNMGIQTIPFNRFTGMKSLINLSLDYSPSSLVDQFPESFKDCKSLTNLSAAGVFNFYNVNESGLREILPQMKQLSAVNLGSCNLRNYIKEFNDLPNLSSLLFGQDGLLPDFSEIDKINPKIKTIRSGSTWGPVTSKKLAGDPTGWMEWYNGKGVENLTLIYMYGQDSFMDLEFLPQWIFEARSLVTLGIGQAFKITSTTDYIDTFINTIYQETIKHPMRSTDTDGKRNQWYGLKFPIWSASYNYGIRPSGNYQATSGFVKGSANGDPKTGMEKIYVLQQNYAQVWTVKPAS